MTFWRGVLFGLTVAALIAVLTTRDLFLLLIWTCSIPAPVWFAYRWGRADRDLDRAWDQLARRPGGRP